jgi:hypothetical protein
MARVLVMAEHTVDRAACPSYREAMTARRECAAAVGANFWAFEHSDVDGHFLEFLEAGSTEALMAAVAELRATGAGFPQLAPVWREVGGV